MLKRQSRRQDYSLYPTRWQELLKMSPQPDFIQIVSWNDYGQLIRRARRRVLTAGAGESHYLVSDSGTPPANTTWLRVAVSPSALPLQLC